MLRIAIHKSLRKFGLDIIRTTPSNENYPPDFGKEDADIVRTVQKYTMTSAERIYALVQAVRYLSLANIAGGIVECGVWRGGSMAAAALTLLQLQDLKRDMYLFDTFQGMTEPTENDVDYEGREAAKLLRTEHSFKCDDASLEVVKHVLLETGYPAERMHFVRGKVEETIPNRAPDLIALLRLDTDWYESTKHELLHLFPRLSQGGVLIIDDYGHWKGAREACDEYFKQNRIPILLNRIDYTGRIALKL